MVGAVERKLLNGIKTMYVNSLACVRVKGGESGGFRIDSGMRQGDGIEWRGGTGV